MEIAILLIALGTFLLTIQNSKQMSDFKQQLDEQFATMNQHITNIAEDLNAKLDEIANAPTEEERTQLVNDAKGIVDRLKAVDDLVPTASEPGEEEPTEPGDEEPLP